MRFSGLLPLALVLLLGACAAPVGVPRDDADVFSDLPETAKADGELSDEESAHRRSVLERMRARYDEIRRLKMEMAIGESFDGLLALPDEHTVRLDEDAEYLAKVLALVEAENADRNAYYDLATEVHRAEIQRQVDEQLPEIRQQVVDQLCAQLPARAICAEISEQVIEVALEEALRVAIDEALAQVRVVVGQIHATYWQRRTTEPGEWIQVAEGDLPDRALRWIEKAK